MKKTEDHQFDEQIRQKMTHLRQDTGMPDWEAFEERLDAAEELDAGPAKADPREVDEVIFGKMHQFEVPYKPSHWARMETTLNELFTWPQYVLRYKSMELALFLLLFITCWQYLPKLGAPVAGLSAPVQQDSYNKAATTAQSDAEREAVMQGGAISGSIAKGHSPTSATASGTASSSEASGAGAASAESRDTPQLTAESLPASSPSAAPSLAYLELLPAAAGRGMVQSEQVLPVHKLPVSFIKNKETLASALPTPARTAMLPGLPFQQLLTDPSTDLGDAKVERIKKGPTLIVGMFGSADYNHIVVPASSEKRLAESFERAALGYGGGLSLSADFGRLEVTLGAIYAARYYPVGIVYVRGGLLSGLRGDELRTTELNILNVPLHFRYDYIQHNKWRAYVLAGGSVQVAFQTNYYTAEAPQYDFMPAILPLVTDGGGESEIDRIRRNGKGWFESGSFEDNAYLSFNFGFGAERYFSDRWSLFVQPVYQHSIHYFKSENGLGPNNDRINSLSVLFGTRVRLR